MLKNYFKLAWRNLWKNKGFSLINILGLSVGIAFTLLIGAYIWGQLQVNHQLKNANNQYILLSKWTDPTQGNEIASAAQLPRALRDNYPNLVANYYHFDGVTTNVSKGDMHFRESLQLGDSTLLNMYGLKLMHGDATTALNDPFSVVLTPNMAMKYFGKTDVIGQTLSFENFGGDKHDFMITGVLANVPRNSVTTLNQYNNSGFFFTTSAAKYFKRNLEGWTNFSTVGYIEVKDGVTAKDLQQPIHDLINKNAAAQVSKTLTVVAVPLKDYYLQAEGGIVKKMCYTLGCIALFILLMAIVNFVNICIGRSSGRMKEMGIRKVLGGLRKQLIWQFLTESVLMVFIATVIALVIYILARPYFSNVLGTQISGLFSFPVYFIAIPFLFALFIGVLAGIYPALVLSALKSIDSLKGKLASVKESVLFRKTLVAFQFGTAAVVFIGAIIISQQIGLFFGNNLGYNKDYVVYAQLPRDWSVKGVQKMSGIRNQLMQMPQVSSVSLSWDIMDGNNGGNFPVYKQGANPAQAVVATGLMVDNEYAATYNIPLKVGTFFKPVFTPADTMQVVINETQSKALGFKTPADAIGQKVMQQGNTSPFTICGVTADFHFGSMQDRITPIFFMNVNYTTYYRFFSIKLKPGNMQQSIAALQKKWAILLPAAPFDYNFMDDALKKVYHTELQLKQAAYIATILAIIIVLLGVLGLISLSIQKRTKEIGIRKVLGSSVTGIISLFMKEFLGVIIIACLVACPIAYLIMSNWLNDYAYRIAISINPFMVAIVALTLVTAMLIAIQTVKAALDSPVKSLRSE
ncbi:ABC transporter permease [Mucilaginibacter sp. FT3.2]|uniref:ABC transporter permease n=1 Tax=Mucilaginibacter sp. FT3.2 TaxID=2723090 RepID=UPI00161A88FC|nr:ABC transporter permease [Mucilaginibacter sp. FT3.2]MBB6231425.1 ABC-type antimicrobial peptide transport system permease subunit [Mucilaginibacter sp. FT3.2]